MRLVRGLAALLLASTVVNTPASAVEAPGDAGTSAILTGLSKAWFKGEWVAYRARFVSADGRVIDNANGDISHSEGQGYGLLLALTARDAKSFATIWSWTSEHLRKRPDALFAWKWDPQRQQVADLNNASDGDVLIAWALARAAGTFGQPDYEVEARKIVDALASTVVVSSHHGTLLLPAAAGFGATDQPGGPVVNLSYWVFAAFRDFARLAPGTDWDGLRQTGYRLLNASRFAPSRLPTDWTALGGDKPEPAANFDAQFGYGAIRIPLYVAQDPDAPREVLARFASGLPAAGPSVIDTKTGAARQTMEGTGYRMILALTRCATHGDVIPPELMSTRDKFYYPETLRLLCVAVLQERLPQCL